MCRTLSAVLPALIIVGLGAAPGGAEVIVRVPFFAVVAGTPGCVPVVQVGVPPFVDVQVRRAARVVPRRSAPVLTRPVVLSDPPHGVQPPPPQPVLPAVQAVTVAEFARTFQPAPGTYEVYLIHPGTKRPVKVVFTLPEGSPKKVKVWPRQLVFDYGKHWVKIRFALRGKVRVTAH
jgi:hypothetical protein